MEQIHANARTTFFLCCLTLFVAIVVGILLSRWILHPLSQLGNASAAIARGNLTRPVAIDGGIVELERLGESFHQMAQQLQASFHALERANVVLEQRVADRTADLQAANCEIRALNQQLTAENVRMRAELDVTRQLQQTILPRDVELDDLADLEIAGFMEPASEVGGDYYDVMASDRHTRIAIGDITGHGLESGVLAIVVQTAVRALLEIDERDPVVLLSALNRTIYQNVQRMQSSKNLTLLLLEYADGTIYVSGQHEEVAIVRHDGSVERIDTIDLGFPIGLVENIAEYVAQQTLRLQTGDVVALYTDGVTEAASPSGELYGVERLLGVLQAHRHLPARAIRQATIEDVRRHIGASPIADDITLPS